ncbi:MAG TPA: hypothetical protein VNJ08_11805 [Bacteriovoracaceae bacterium]|nr:hypothetical protein [Bacteriovoracaceae bacterium]
MPHPIELPPRYYLSHFRELLEDITKRFQSFLRPVHLDFLKEFYGLSEDAQCLYVRMVNRKGAFFFKDSLSYQEINNIPAGLIELEKFGFIRMPVARDVEGIINFLPKDDLIAMISSGTLDFRKSWSREKLKELAMLHFHVPDGLVVQGRTDQLQYLLFLFFGKIQESLTLYTLRDLGIRKANSYQGSMKAKFKSLEEAEAHYFYARLNHEFCLQFDLTSWPIPLNTESEMLREGLLLRMAEHHKKDENYEEALSYLRGCVTHPGRERLCRLLYQLTARLNARNYYAV